MKELKVAWPGLISVPAAKSPYKDGHPYVSPITWFIGNANELAKDHPDRKWVASIDQHLKYLYNYPGFLEDVRPADMLSDYCLFEMCNKEDDETIKNYTYLDCLESGENFVIILPTMYYETVSGLFRGIRRAVLPAELLEAVHRGQCKVLFICMPEGMGRVGAYEAIKVFCKNNSLQKNEVYLLFNNMNLEFKELVDREGIATLVPIPYFEWQPWFSWSKEEGLQNIADREKRAPHRMLCLNRRANGHRYFFTMYLEATPEVGNQVLWSRWVGDFARYWTVDLLQYKMVEEGLQGSKYWNIVLDQTECYRNRPVEDFVRPLDTKPSEDCPADTENVTWITPIYKQADIMIVTETWFTELERVAGGKDLSLFLTEKTFKAIYEGMPFLLIAQPGALKELHRAGYKTFSRWWDESYDDEVDPAKRMDKIIEVVTKLAKMSDEEFDKMMREIREEVIPHNIEVFTEKAAKNLVFNTAYSIQERDI